MSTSTETYQITVSGIAIDVVRKDIKNLRLGVYPPGGRVRVAVPLGTSEEAVRLAVVGNLGWIKRQQAKFESQPRQSQREMVSGESHYFLGSRYRLNVVVDNGPGKVVLRNQSHLDIFVRPDTGPDFRERMLYQWYRRQLRMLIPPLVSRWEQILGVRVAEWGIKRMKTKWGSCNIQARRIWLNLELAKKSVHCLEYIVIHEMIHLLERRHNGRFSDLMDAHLPQWRLYRDELNGAPLAYETWRP